MRSLYLCMVLSACLPVATTNSSVSKIAPVAAPLPTMTAACINPLTGLINQVLSSDSCTIAILNGKAPYTYTTSMAGATVTPSTGVFQAPHITTASYATIVVTDSTNKTATLNVIVNLFNVSCLNAAGIALTQVEALSNNPALSTLSGTPTNTTCSITSVYSGTEKLPTIVPNTLATITSATAPVIAITALATTPPATPIAPFLLTPSIGSATTPQNATITDSYSTTSGAIASSNLVITVLPPMTANITPAPEVKDHLLIGQSYTVTITGGTGNYAITFASVPAGNTVTLTSTNSMIITTQSTVPAAPVTITITVSDGLNTTVYTPQILTEVPANTLSATTTPLVAGQASMKPGTVDIHAAAAWQSTTTCNNTNFFIVAQGGMDFNNPFISSIVAGETDITDATVNSGSSPLGVSQSPWSSVTNTNITAANATYLEFPTAAAGVIAGAGGPYSYYGLCHNTANQKNIYFYNIATFTSIGGGFYTSYGSFLKALQQIVNISSSNSSMNVIITDFVTPIIAANNTYLSAIQNIIPPPNLILIVPPGTKYSNSGSSSTTFDLANSYMTGYGIIPNAFAINTVWGKSWYNQVIATLPVPASTDLAIDQTTFNYYNCSSSTPCSFGGAHFLAAPTFDAYYDLPMACTGTTTAASTASGTSCIQATSGIYAGPLNTPVSSLVGSAYTAGAVGLYVDYYMKTHTTSPTATQVISALMNPLTATIMKANITTTVGTTTTTTKIVPYLNLQVLYY